jgi:hypothetical protein
MTGMKTITANVSGNTVEVNVREHGTIYARITDQEGYSIYLEKEDVQRIAELMNKVKDV